MCDRNRGKINQSGSRESVSMAGLWSSVLGAVFFPNESRFLIFRDVVKGNVILQYVMGIIRKSSF